VSALKARTAAFLVLVVVVIVAAIALQVLVRQRAELVYTYIAPNRTELSVKDLQGHQILLTIEGGCLTSFCGKTINAFEQEDVIALKLENTGEKPISLPNTAPWAIYEVKCVQGVFTRVKLVYQPIAAQVVVELKPGQTLAWTISLEELSKQVQVKPGTYEIAFKTMELGEVSLYIAVKGQSL